MKKNIVTRIRRIVKWTAPHAKLMARRLARVTQRSPIMDTLLARATAPFISTYRMLLSPYKGFRCAHAIVTDEPSCSDVALNAFRTTTFASAVVIVDEQLVKCRHSYLTSYSNLIDEAINHLPSLSGSADYAMNVGAFDCCDPDSTPPPHP